MTPGELAYNRYVLTMKAHILLAKCDGRWEMPCRWAFPASRWMWCLGCA